MRYLTKAAAEQAALDGRGEECDTQLCIGLQAEILSSSPIPETVALASSIDAVVVHPNVIVDAEAIYEATANSTRADHPKDRNQSLSQSALQLAANDKDVGCRSELPPHGKNSPCKDSVSKGVQGPFELELAVELTTALKTAQRMEDLTQKSSLSLTQENPESAYERFRAESKDAAQGAGPKASAHESKPDSTMQTYLEDHTGHVNFDSAALSLGEAASQDALRLPPTQFQSTAHLLEPQTPAQPINPFLSKGSVLKAIDMFEQTQPISAGPKASPTSSRPSPDFRSNRPIAGSYDDFTSPQRRVPTSPLQSSVRRLLSSPSTDSPICSKSFDLGHVPKRTNTLPEPRMYVSMKESQERRREESSSVSPGSEKNSLGSDTEDFQRKRQQRLLREKDISKELATIEIQKKLQSSSRLGSLELVEVPSTTRRRSLPEDYIAQYTGFDARDTQQNDMVVDSQDALRAKELSNPVTPPEHSDTPLDIPAERKRDVNPIKLVTTALSFTNVLENSEADLPGPRHPLQERFSNRSNLQTPMPSKVQSNRAIIPETSPLEPRLRPMTDIASLSFGADPVLDPLCSVPGFTQDSEFETAMRIQQSPFNLPCLHNTVNRKIGLQGITNKVVGQSTDSTGIVATDQTPAILRIKTPSSALTSIGSSMFELSTSPEAALNAIPSAKTSTPTPTSISKSQARRQSTRRASQKPATKQSSLRRASTQLGRDSSEDRIALAAPLLIPKTKRAGSLFQGMAFAVSYAKHYNERDAVSGLIVEHGGQILEDGFAILFDSSTLSKTRIRTGDNVAKLTLTSAAKSTGFVALIADEHSRKAKYMEALALGLPCISGLWITACVAKADLLDWSLFLLSAGQSSFLGNAIKSRVIRPYAASDAKFMEIFAARDKLLDGKSVLLITGKGRTAEDRRKPYIFLTRAMEPLRLCQVSDNAEARKKLLESQEQNKAWDLLYVDGNEDAAASAIFGNSTATLTGTAKKRKRGPTQADVKIGTPLKRVRLISDEDVIQSLILGQLLEL